VVVVGLIINWILWIFLLILFARTILSWVPVLVRDWEPRGPMLVFAEIIYSITDPPLRLLRKVLKPVRVGNMMLDLAFIGLAILVSILMQVNRSLFLFVLCLHDHHLHSQAAPRTPLESPCKALVIGV